MYHNHTNCRVCQSKNLTEYLDLGMMPLSNNLCNTATEEAERFPLKVLLCEDCGLSQLSIVIDPQTLFGTYVYRSSISQGYKDHCRDMAESFATRLTKDSFHIDIAGNDGALLHEFNQVIGCKTLNIDPAANMVPICEAKGIRQYETFWGYDAVRHLISTGWPKADLITATNVFAHVDNVREFLEAAKMVLAPDGVLVLEFPYLVDFIEKKEFDTVYFEHLSYFSISPLYKLCTDVGLSIMSVSHKDIHGGSIRVEIGFGKEDEADYTMDEILDGYHNIDTYHQWASDVKEVIGQFRKRLTLLKLSGNKIAGFAASAKGNTLLNSAGITNEVMDYIVDQTPEKVGKFSPGTHIPIVSMVDMICDPPDYIVLLSWNFADECMSKCRAAGYTGRFILPLTFEVI
jgi:SAM-dependent methyltransferase